MTKPLFKRNDARRMVKTCIQFRNQQGEKLEISTRRMNTVAANLAAAFVARPRSQRTVRLAEVRPNTIVLKLGTY